MRAFPLQHCLEHKYTGTERAWIFFCVLCETRYTKLVTNHRSFNFETDFETYFFFSRQWTVSKENTHVTIINQSQATSVDWRSPNCGSRPDRRLYFPLTFRIILFYSNCKDGGGGETNFASCPWRQENSPEISPEKYKLKLVFWKTWKWQKTNFVDGYSCILIL